MRFGLGKSLVKTDPASGGAYSRRSSLGLEVSPARVDEIAWRAARQVCDRDTGQSAPKIGPQRVDTLHFRSKQLQVSVGEIAPGRHAQVHRIYLRAAIKHLVVQMRASRAARC